MRPMRSMWRLNPTIRASRSRYTWRHHSTEINWWQNHSGMEMNIKIFQPTRTLSKDWKPWSATVWVSTGGRIKTETRTTSCSSPHLYSVSKDTISCVNGLSRQRRRLKSITGNHDRVTCQTPTPWETGQLRVHQFQGKRHPMLQYW